ncbi:hypothetical protein C8R43DRAFT_942613 [Mycena crocata]|nr:hypothetical protein C8R43DRAFT_942613 [Mycena crocata]
MSSTVVHLSTARVSIHRPSFLPLEMELWRAPANLLALRLCLPAPPIGSWESERDPSTSPTRSVLGRDITAMPYVTEAIWAATPSVAGISLVPTTYALGSRTPTRFLFQASLSTLRPSTAAPAPIQQRRESRRHSFLLPLTRLVRRRKLECGRVDSTSRAAHPRVPAEDASLVLRMLSVLSCGCYPVGITQHSRFSAATLKGDCDESFLHMDLHTHRRFALAISLHTLAISLHPNAFESIDGTETGSSRKRVREGVHATVHDERRRRRAVRDEYMGLRLTTAGMVPRWNVREYEPRGRVCGEWRPRVWARARGAVRWDTCSNRRRRTSAWSCSRRRLRPRGCRGWATHPGHADAVGCGAGDTATREHVANAHPARAIEWIQESSSDGAGVAASTRGEQGRMASVWGCSRRPQGSYAGWRAMSGSRGRCSPHKSTHAHFCREDAASCYGGRRAAADGEGLGRPRGDVERENGRGRRGDAVGCERTTRRRCIWEDVVYERIAENPQYGGRARAGEEQHQQDWQEKGMCALGMSASVPLAHLALSTHVDTREDVPCCCCETRAAAAGEARLPGAAAHGDGVARDVGVRRVVECAVVLKIDRSGCKFKSTDTRGIPAKASRGVEDAQEPSHDGGWAGRRVEDTVPNIGDVAGGEGGERSNAGGCASRNLSTRTGVLGLILGMTGGRRGDALICEGGCGRGTQRLARGWWGEGRGTIGEHRGYTSKRDRSCRSIRRLTSGILARKNKAEKAGFSFGAYFSALTLSLRTCRRNGWNADEEVYPHRMASWCSLPCTSSPRIAAVLPSYPVSPSPTNSALFFLACLLTHAALPLLPRPSALRGWLAACTTFQAAGGGESRRRSASRRGALKHSSHHTTVAAAPEAWTRIRILRIVRAAQHDTVDMTGIADAELRCDGEGHEIHPAHARRGRRLLTTMKLLFTYQHQGGWVAPEPYLRMLALWRSVADTLGVISNGLSTVLVHADTRHHLSSHNQYDAEMSSRPRPRLSLRSAHLLCDTGNRESSRRLFLQNAARLLMEKVDAVTCSVDATRVVHIVREFLPYCEWPSISRSTEISLVLNNELYWSNVENIVPQKEGEQNRHLRLVARDLHSKAVALTKRSQYLLLLSEKKRRSNAVGPRFTCLDVPASMFGESCQNHNFVLAFPISLSGPLACTSATSSAPNAGESSPDLSKPMDQVPATSSSAWNPLLKSFVTNTIQPKVDRWRNGLDSLLVFHEEVIPEMQALDILGPEGNRGSLFVASAFKERRAWTEARVARDGPEGKTNKEKFQWRTTPQGAATLQSSHQRSYPNDSAIANTSIAAHSSDPMNIHS